MSNWAALKEKEYGLPVHKRARYGIHFDRGGGEILAEFTGKPCHYLDNGLWKPIDTALLPTADGWYSSPHSDVVIHPDGRVRVRNSDYQQFTGLPSAKAGRLDGDKIIREFPGGEQHLIMKEDGFREEIHVFKPTFPLERFIAKTTGKLPGKYRANPITAQDAEGNVYEFKGNMVEFGSWLEKAIYPVVIDPDFVLQPAEAEAQDTYIAIAAPNNQYSTMNVINFRGYLRADAIIGLLSFDLSSIPSGATVLSAVLTTQLVYNQLRTSQIIYHRILSGNNGWIEACTWNYAIPTTQAWAGSAGALTSGTDYDPAALGTQIITAGDLSGSQYNTSLDTTEVEYMISNNYGFLGHYYEADVVTFASSNYGTASARPKLSITYSAGGVPKHFMYYQRLRSL